jgi:hypothetical protein
MVAENEKIFSATKKILSETKKIFSVAKTIFFVFATFVWETQKIVADLENIFSATEKMVAAIEKIFSFVKKMVSGIQNIFCVTKLIFMTSGKIVAAPKTSVSIACGRWKIFKNEINRVSRRLSAEIRGPKDLEKTWAIWPPNQSSIVAKKMGLSGDADLANWIA